ncbi:hypothetical protein F3Y22_tig00110895pilonHSYRG00451 [Hibiscus syriacus]|uniref:CPL domain-containing protein n=1 Tax=Hibiscus syriacus TaxID=106335 RepID=A0A6A2ZFV5_HIBSY|nr:hypothetical protein F3Y22_tig00110895pilonHSYRG00451 [Hibiscus syriacus]
MAAKNQQTQKPKKRKQISSSNTDRDSSKSKKPRLLASIQSKNPSHKPLKKPFNPSKQKYEHPSHSKFRKQDYGSENKELSKRERRIQAKDLAEARKKKRKPHYTLEQELASLWEKMRRRNIAKEDRSKLITEALQKMKGKIPEIAVHLVKKMLDAASKKQLAGVISTLRGHVASLLRHMVGSVVVEHAYQLGNASQKQELLMELYSTELHLFKGLASIKESRLIDVISKLGLQKSSVLRHMSSVIQPIIEKGIVDHSIIHRVLVEYLNIADQSSAADIIQQLSGPLLVRMIHTRDGSKIGMLCVKHASAKLKATLKELALDKSGRRLLLHLLHPNCSRYLISDGLAFLNLSVPSLTAKNDSEVGSEKISRDKESNKKAAKSDIPEENLYEPTKETATSDPDMTETESGKSDIPEESLCSAEGGKKDPSLRRRELLVKSGLAENLVDVCIEDAGELLTSNFGKEVIFEVAMGGSDGILRPTLDEKLNKLHEAIAALAAKRKSEEREESEEEHVLENFHSNRTIRKLILDCPAFASTLWKKSLEGKCQLWAQGHSSKVLSAYRESLDSEVRKMAEEELKSLIDGGILKISENKQSANAD